MIISISDTHLLDLNVDDSSTLLPSKGSKGWIGRRQSASPQMFVFEMFFKGGRARWAMVKEVKETRVWWSPRFCFLRRACSFLIFLVFLCQFFMAKMLGQHFFFTVFSSVFQALALEPARASAFQKCAVLDSGQSGQCRIGRWWQLVDVNGVTLW